MAISNDASAPTADTRQSGDGLARHSRSSSRLAWLRPFWEDKPTLVSVLFVLVVAVAAISAPLLTPYDPGFSDPLIRLNEPSAGHWLGTDDLGRDVLTRLMFGARTSLLVGAIVTASAVLVGSFLGLLATYYNRLDTPIMRLMDGLMAFPSILLAIAIMASLGPSVANVIIALAIVYTPQIVRLVRGTSLSVIQEPYVESARAIGCPDYQILAKYVFVNSLSPLIVQATFVVALAIIAEASLSFLGAGVPVETPTWGNMLRDGQRLMSRAWWLAVFPGTALFFLILALNLIGDRLRDATDPSLRER